MQGLGPTAQLEHLAQYGDSPLGGRIAQHVDHGAHRVRIRVVAIVQDEHAITEDPLATHRAGRESLHHRRELVRANPIYRRDSEAGQNVQNAMAAY